jgi:hypothetical protein
MPTEGIVRVIGNPDGNIIGNVTGSIVGMELCCGKLNRNINVVEVANENVLYKRRFLLFM